MERLKTLFTALANRLLIGLLVMPLVPWSLGTLLARYRGVSGPQSLPHSLVEHYLDFYGHLGQPGNLLWVLAPALLYLLTPRRRRQPPADLAHAVGKGRDETVRQLIEDGADVHLPNVRGQTPLHLAAMTDNVDVVRMLVSGGADVDVTEPAEQLRPLHNCAINDCRGVCEFLLQHGADMDARTASGDTPLHLAARHGRADVVALLLGFHADHGLKNAAGETAAELAATHGHPAIVDLIEQHAIHEWRYPRTLNRKAS